MSNLRDANIFQDFTVWVNNVGKLGEAPGFQPPEINIATEEYRGGGMDGTAEIPHGVEKIEFTFDLHTWDPDVWTLIGYGPGALDVPVEFRGYVLSPNGSEGQVKITTRSLLKSIKPDNIEAGKKTKVTTTCVANYFKHEVRGRVVTEIDVFMKKMILGGEDKSQNARRFLGFTY